MKKHYLAVFALALITICASAQDLKPSRDKASKKYGYINKSKTWVIEPSFDKAEKFRDGFAIVEAGGFKGLIDASGEWILRPEYDDIDHFKRNGLCRIMQKDSRARWYGVADQTGRIVMPVEFRGIGIDASEGVITAETYMDVSEFGAFGSVLMWGVYDEKGNEVFAPQFSYQPSFSYGRATVRDEVTRLEGVISADGKTIVPLENLEVDRESGEYLVLTSDFMAKGYTQKGALTFEAEYPGYVAPYNVDSDPVRAALYGKCGIGMKAHANNLYAFSWTGNYSGTCHKLGIDWGSKLDRFVRLEPVMTKDKSKSSLMDEVSEQYYTIAACLYEANGEYVEDISSCGYIAGTCREGIIYCNENGDHWFLMSDINAPMGASIRMSLTDLSKPYGYTIQRAFGFEYEDKRIITSWDKFCEAQRIILFAENPGLLSYTPLPSGDLEGMRTADRIASCPALRYGFTKYDVVQVKRHDKEDAIELSPKKDFVMTFVNDFGKPDFKYEGTEEIFWGARGDRYVCIEMVPHRVSRKDEADSTPFMWDDVYRSGCAYSVAVCLYEADGTFVRVLTEADCISHISEEGIYIEQAGLFFSARPVREGQRIILPASSRIPRKVSVIENAGRRGGHDKGSHHGGSHQSDNHHGDNHGGKTGSNVDDHGNHANPPAGTKPATGHSHTQGKTGSSTRNVRSATRR